MLQLRLDAEQLCSTLTALEPVQLKGLALLQSGQRPLGLLPNSQEIPRETPQADGSLLVEFLAQPGRKG